MSVTHRLKELTRPTGEEEILPVEYPVSRYRVEPRQAVAVGGVVLATALAWVGLRVYGSASQTRLEPTWETAVATSTAPSDVVVSVVGEVERPALVTLENGARVADALASAKPLPSADLVALNQAQPVADGQQIVVQAIGAAPPAGVAPTAVGAAPGKVSLNSASSEQLVALPGVGEATAAAIIAHRETAGPFTAVDQLMDVKGIGPAKFEALKDLVVP
ncbi:ComE operon protein 1 [Corynebacterium capitovis DSM 44611]|uniref:ComEA family DNA-binding protein n=1 Tax=Corynebacterium capitovis TaxID=131081 RepID=UPI000370AECF|nr:ComEA family DNA-binding protein [Corynebacterium capitovis]WKD57201.1 ComE operon protein 1 [Corynebacterium capitovis DSM 44611]